MNETLIFIISLFVLCMSIAFGNSQYYTVSIWWIKGIVWFLGIMSALMVIGIGCSNTSKHIRR
jgi:hypothetical protein